MSHLGQASVPLPEGEEVHLPPLAGTGARPMFHVQFPEGLIEGLLEAHRKGDLDPSADMFHVTFDSNGEGHIETAGDSYPFSNLQAADDAPATAMTAANGGLAALGEVASTLRVDARPNEENAPKSPAAAAASSVDGAGNTERAASPMARLVDRRSYFDRLRTSPDPRQVPGEWNFPPVSSSDESTDDASPPRKSPRSVSAGLGKK